MTVNGKRGMAGGLGLLVMLFSFSVLVTRPLHADGKKLEVTAGRAEVRIDPSSRSALVAVLDQGAILTLASPAKMKVNWFYVYFLSPGSGQTRAGYVHDSQVRPLYPLVKVINISTGGKETANERLDPGSGGVFEPSWGATLESILRTEGRPTSDESKDGLRVLRYRRNIMNRKWLVDYVLGGQGLITTRYKLLEEYADNSHYLEDYNTLRAYLNGKVGEPRSDKTVWKNKVFEKNAEDPVEALTRGHVAYSSEWVFRDTSVRIMLGGEGSMVALNAEIQDVKSGYSLE